MQNSPTVLETVLNTISEGTALNLYAELVEARTALRNAQQRDQNIGDPTVAQLDDALRVVRGNIIDRFFDNLVHNATKPPRPANAIRMMQEPQS